MTAAPWHEAIAWTLDGADIPVGDWSAEDEVNGGYGPARLTCAAKYVVNADQGSKLVAYRAGGEVLWSGDLAAPPTIIGDNASLASNGLREKLDSLYGRLPFQIRGATLFVAGDANPHEYNISEKFHIDAKHANLRWRCQKNQDYASGNQAGFVLWVAGHAVKRIAFKAHSTGNANFDLKYQMATGPDGALGTENLIVTLNAASDGTSQDVTIGGNKDLLYLFVKATAAVTPTITEHFWLSDFRVNFLAPGDSFQTADVVATVFDLAGLDSSRVENSGVNILPLDWTDGSHAELADYMAELDQWRWRTYETRDGIRGGEYGPWKTTWTGSAEFSAGYENTELGRIYNRAVIGYETTGGQPATFTLDADPDPLSATGATTEIRADVSDVQDQTATGATAKQNATLAANYAQNLLDYYATRRLVGDVSLWSVDDGSGAQSPYAVRAGDLYLPRDHEPPIGAQRIVRVAWSRDAPPVVTLSDELSPLQILSRGRRHRARRHRGRRHHGR